MMRRRLIPLAAVVFAVVLIAAVWPVTVDVITVDDGTLTELEVTRDDTGERYRLPSPVALEPIPSPTPTESPSPSEPPPAGCTETLSGAVTDADGFTVPAGETWCFDPAVTTTVTVEANVVVEGELEMRPSDASVVHTLRFAGVDETLFVGGHTDTPLATDVGLWVMGDGVLDLQGTPKTGWNRTGSDPTWQTSDELVETPMTPGDDDGFAAYDGTVDTSTAPDGTVHHAEVLNLTRNVRVHGGGSNPTGILSADGRAHVFITSTQPQTIRHAELRWLGPRKPKTSGGGNADTDGVTGRYGLHFHLSGDGSRGSVVEGTVLRDFGSNGYVPHTSHGITFSDTIAYGGYEPMYWWDDDAETDDLTIARAVAAKGTAYPSYEGFGVTGFTLGEGRNTSIRDSVAVGMQSKGVNDGGFLWPNSANHADNNVWDFADNVAHNNRGSGINNWIIDSKNADVVDSVAFNNGKGLMAGAYTNQFHYVGVDTWDNTIGIEQRALTSNTAEPDGQRSLEFRDLTTGDVRITAHSIASTQQPTVYRDVEIRGQVTIDKENKPGLIEFRSTVPANDLTPADFNVVSCVSTVTVFNSDGSQFQVCP